MNIDWERNWGIFYNPRKWRIEKKAISNVKVFELCVQGNSYDLLLKVVDAERNEYFFYEAVVVKESVAKGERCLGEISLDGRRAFIVDRYTCLEELNRTLREMAEGAKVGKLRYAGEVENWRVESVELMFSGEETTNLLYKLTVTDGARRRKLLLKRFLPRYPVDRGSKELLAIRALKECAPELYGTVEAEIAGKYVPVVLLVEFVEDYAEVGSWFWSSTVELVKLAQLGLEATATVNRMKNMAKRIANDVLIPLHKRLTEEFGGQKKIAEEVLDAMAREFRENLSVVVGKGLLPKAEAAEVLRVVDSSLKKLLLGERATEVHGDLMWRQILWSHRKRRFYVIDLDEHHLNHRAKDVADLVAALRFIAEEATVGVKEDVKSLVVSWVEAVGEELLKSYFGRPTPEDRARVALYLCFRHLHDCAYFLPVAEEKGGAYSRYVDFSLKWFKLSFENLTRFLKATN